MKMKILSPNALPILATIGLTTLILGTKGADVAKLTSSLPPEISKNLILYYDFNSDPIAGKIADKSGHGNDGLVVNVTFVSDGHQGGAAKFGLNNSYITVPNNEELNPRRLTVSTWINTSYSDKIWRRIFDKGCGKGFSLSDGGDYQKWHQKGQLIWETSVADAGSSPRRIDDGQWHHVVGTYDGADATVYLDGLSVGKSGHKVGEIAHNDYDLTIGANRSNPDGALGEIGPSFYGLMDDVMLFNRALTADEVQAVFKSQGGVLVPQPASAPVSATQDKPSATDRLKQVKQLFDQGLINKEDYDKKVKEIMDSL